MLGDEEWKNGRIEVENMEEKTKYITHFQDLYVYQRLFKLSRVVIKKIIPKLPNEEKYDLSDQMRRAAKACTAIIAEGFPKRFQKKHWSKYLTDAIGECDEMINHLMQIQNLYDEIIKSDSIQIVINEYEISKRQLFALDKSWKDYHKK